MINAEIEQSGLGKQLKVRIIPFQYKSIRANAAICRYNQLLLSCPSVLRWHHPYEATMANRFIVLGSHMTKRPDLRSV